MLDNSQIIITKDIDLYLGQLVPSLPLHTHRIFQNEEENKDNFKIEQAKKVIKEAYIASSESKYIILCGNKFELEAQNKLLKILEEPPKNIIFIIITTSKSNLLPTIISRLPHKYIKSLNKKEYSNHNIFKKDLKDIYLFLKENQRISKNDAKDIIQSILYESKSLNIKLEESELLLFSKSIKLLELNSKPINILTTVLLTILNIKNRIS
ncbi:MAG: DNA polymerase III subunit delta' [Campylobacteraceae bacterium]|jgi:DNA polymerase-3 subunit delta'|nr:DNA polymerase III subunit delta' [Campylobacteraceae bacterium]